MTVRTAAAGLMMLGGLVIIAGCVGGVAYVFAHPNWLDAQLAAAAPEVAEQFDAMLPSSLRTYLLAAVAFGGVIEGAASIYVGWAVARGHAWAIRTSLALTSLRLVLVVLMALVTLLAAAVAGAASRTVMSDAAGTTVTVVSVPLSPGASYTIVGLTVAAAVLIATLVLLFAARRSTPPALPTVRTS